MRRKAVVQKNGVKRTERQATAWENIFGNAISVKQDIQNRQKLLKSQQ